MARLRPSVADASARQGRGACGPRCSDHVWRRSHRSIERRGFAAHNAGPTLQQSYAAAPQRAWRSWVGRPSSAISLRNERWRSRPSSSSEPQRSSAPATCCRCWPTVEPDLVIHDNLELGAPAAAESLGIPHVTHSYGPIVPAPTGFPMSWVGHCGRRICLTQSAASSSALLEHLPTQSPTVWKQRALGSAGRVGPYPARSNPVTSCRRIRRPAAPADHLSTLGTIMNQRPEVFRAVLTGAPSIRERRDHPRSRRRPGRSRPAASERARCVLPAAGAGLGALHSRRVTCRGRHHARALCFGYRSSHCRRAPISRITQRRWWPPARYRARTRSNHSRRHCRIVGPGTDGAGYPVKSGGHRAEIAGMQPLMRSWIS